MLPRFVQYAPLYRSLPVEELKRLASGRSVRVLGSASKGLVQTLSLAKSKSTVLSGRFQVDVMALAEVLERSPPADVTIVSDPDWADIILANDDLLFVLRQKSREALVLPQVCRPAGLAFMWRSDASAHETDGAHHWRWAQSLDSRLSLRICGPVDPQRPALLHFSVWLAPHASNELCRTELTVEYAGDELRFVVGVSDVVEIPLARAVSDLILRTPITARASDSDSRRLSFAVVDPVIVDLEGRTLVGSEQICKGGYSWPASVQDRLHRSGFYAVGGIVRSSSWEDLPGRNYPFSRGDPHIGLHSSEMESWFSLEANRDATEVLWLVAANNELTWTG